MRFECKNLKCDHRHTETSTTMRVRDGEIRYFDSNNNFADVCPKCDSRCKETTKKEGVPGMSFFDNGSGKKKVL